MQKIRNKALRFMKIFNFLILIVAILFVLLFFYFLFLSSNSEFDIFESTKKVISVMGAFILLLVVVLIVCSIIFSKKYYNALFSTRQKRTFKYLDYYYYSNYEMALGEYQFVHYGFHIIQDISSEKIYAIYEKDSNAGYQKLFSKENIVILDIKNRREVNFGEQGVFWIDQEFTDWYQNNGDGITFTFFDVQHKVKNDSKLFHLNQDYDFSLLDKATLITGYAEFKKN